PRSRWSGPPVVLHRANSRPPRWVFLCANPTHYVSDGRTSPTANAGQARPALRIRNLPARAASRLHTHDRCGMVRHMGGDHGLPSGVVSFVFTDVEGSTRLLRELGDRYGELIDLHHELLRAAWAAHGGHELHTEGDAFAVVFADA